MVNPARDVVGKRGQLASMLFALMVRTTCSIAKFNFGDIVANALYSEFNDTWTNTVLLKLTERNFKTIHSESASTKLVPATLLKLPLAEFHNNR